MTLFAVETYDNLFLGTVDFHEGKLVVRPGHRGHPFEVPQDEVLRLVPAEEYDGTIELT